MIPVIGLIAGIVIGMFLPVNIPPSYSKYVAIAILPSLDTVFGGLSSNLQGNFNLKIFLSGFIANAVLAAGLAFMGEKIGVDIFQAAAFVFIYRMFLNLAIIRRYLLDKWPRKNSEKSK